MIADLKPYPQMKDSGVPWLGEVPEHWEMSRLGYVASLVVPMRDKPSDLSGEIPWVRIEDFNGRYIITSRSRQGVSAVTMRKMNLKVLPPGTVLCSCSCSMGATAIVKVPLVSNQTFIGIIPGHRLESEYVYWLMQVSKDHLTQMATGAIQQYLSRDDFSSLKIIVPPLPEQAAIGRFLDHADRRIRRYILAKQKLIKLLEEQKQAIIHRAVTGGLGPNVRLKNSGVGWLGDVPEHWEVKRLKAVVSSVTSGSRGWSSFAADAGVLFIRIGNLTRTSIDLDTEKMVRLQLPSRVLGEAARTRVRAHDILLSITAFIGSVAVVPVGIEEAYVSQHVACCRPHAGAANPRWVAYVLLSPVGQKHGKLSMYGGTKQGLSLDDVKNYVVLLPPLDEQERLVDWIESTSSGVDAGIRSTKREISLLREFRTRLIADVVTGKLDVREAAARLPDEAAEPEPLDEADALTDAVEDTVDDLDAVPEEAES